MVGVHQQQQQLPYILELNANDVLFGRGAPAILNDGNRRFRALVSSKKGEYMSTAKRAKKDKIARSILETIAGRGGRFLRRVESLVEAEELGIPSGATAWVRVDETSIMLKIKQALRDRDSDQDEGEDMNISARVAGNPLVDQQVQQLQQLQYRQQMQNQLALAQLQGQNQIPSFMTQMNQQMANRVDPVSFLLASNQMNLQQNIPNDTLRPQIGVPYQQLAERNQIFSIGHSSPNLARTGMSVSSSPSRLSSPKRPPNSNQSTSAGEAIRESLVSHPDKDKLGLSLIETFLITALCSKGLPSDWDEFANGLTCRAAEWKEHAVGSVSGPDLKAYAESQTKKWSQNKDSLIRTTLRLCERFRCFASGAEESKAGVNAWFDNEICRKANSIGAADLTGRPLPFSAQDYRLESGSIVPQVALISYFSAKSASAVYCQIACLTWLQEVTGKGDVDIVRQAARSAFFWNRQPDDWDVLDDIDLLKCLCKVGYAGVLDTPLGSSTLRSRGLSKVTVEERISSLATRLHEICVEKRREELVKEFCEDNECGEEPLAKRARVEDVLGGRL